MERHERRLPRGTATGELQGGPQGDPANPAAATRRARDEAEASSTRVTCRGGLPALPADAIIAPLLRHGEHVLAVLPTVAADRRLDAPAEAAALPSGPLYITSERLVLAGGTVVEVPLCEIDEVGVVGEDRLLVALSRGRALMLVVARPRVLRVQISAARWAERRARAVSPHSP